MPNVLTAARLAAAAGLVFILSCAPIARVKNTQEGYNALERGDLDAAIQYCTMAANAEPTRPQPQECLGHAYFRADEFELALTHFEQARQNHSQMEDLDTILVKLYIKNGERLADAGSVEAAGAMYEKALAIAPDNAVVHNNLGVLNMKKGDNETAAKHLRIAVEQDDQFWEAWNNLGLVHVALGQYDAAFDNFRTAYRINRDAKAVYTGMANAYADINQSFAERRFRREAARVAGDSGAVQLLSDEEMEICLDMAASKAGAAVPNEANVMRIKARTLSEEGNPAKAEAVYLRALNLAPWDVDNRWELAQTQMKLKFADEARLTLRCMLEFPLDNYRQERAKDMIYRLDVLNK